MKWWCNCVAIIFILHTTFYINKQNVFSFLHRMEFLALNLLSNKICFRKIYINVTFLYFKCDSRWVYFLPVFVSANLCFMCCCSVLSLINYTICLFNTITLERKKKWKKELETFINTLSTLEHFQNVKHWNKGGALSEKNAFYTVTIKERSFILIVD